MGYTVFEIASHELRGPNADAVAFDVAANGTPVRIDGLPGDQLSLPFKPGEDVRLRFALQTLDFDGRVGGCDLVSIELKFSREGVPVGQPVRLQRLYSALRDAGEVVVRSEIGQFSWSGKYHQPRDKLFDSEVFVNSVQFKSIDDAVGQEKARKAIEELQRLVNHLDLTFQGRRVVAVVRPSLTKPQFGLALGVVQDTDQIQFTFPKADRCRSYRMWRRTTP